MRTAAFRFRFALALLLCLSLPSLAAAERREALVIGNGDYAELGRLKNPANDATDMAAALRGLGFQVKLLTDADLPSMEDAVIRLGNDLAQSADSIGFFFYAGHGVQSGGVNYLIPADARIGSEAFLKTKALPAQSVLDTLQGARNALNIVVLDACRDNPFSWGRSAARGLGVVGSQPPGSIIAYATSAGSAAQDGQGRNGVFTAELLKQIRTPGLEIKEVFNRTGAAVQSATSGRQVPAVYNQFFANAYLAGAKAASPAAASAPAAPATPTMTLTRAYGSLVVTAASAGTLYLDGQAMGDLPAGAKATLDSVETGDRNLELRYADGQVERQGATVEEGRAASVAFAYRKAVPQATAPAPEAPVPAGFVAVPAGSFTMGSPEGEAGRYSNENQHQVSLSGFLMGACEVTEAEWSAVMGSNPSLEKGDNLPVERVSWYDCLVYCNKRSAREGLRPCYSVNGSSDPARWGAVPSVSNATWNAAICDFGADGYRLPTEAEWEYAAKGGPAASGLGLTAVYAGQSDYDRVGWVKENSGGDSHPVGRKSANALGLFDMVGNIAEWCWDWNGAYPIGATRDPIGPASGKDRIVRGGTFLGEAKGARSANRLLMEPEYRGCSFGLRPVRSSPGRDGPGAPAAAGAKASPLPTGSVALPDFASLLGLSPSDTIDVALAKMGQPSRQDPNPQYSFGDCYWDLENENVLNLSFDKGTRRITWITVKAADADSPAATRRYFSDKGIRDPRLDFLGKPRDEILARFGKPDSVNSDNYQYERSAGGIDLSVTFVCYSFNGYLCSEIMVNRH